MVVTFVIDTEGDLNNSDIIFASNWTGEPTNNLVRFEQNGVDVTDLVNSRWTANANFSACICYYTPKGENFNWDISRAGPLFYSNALQGWIDQFGGATNYAFAWVRLAHYIGPSSVAFKPAKVFK